MNKVRQSDMFWREEGEELSVRIRSLGDDVLLKHEG